MPKIVVAPAGEDVVVGDIVDGSLRIIGLYGNGANDVAMTAEAAAALKKGNSSGTYIDLPAAADDMPIKYLVKYEREMGSGAMLQNTTAVSSDLVKLTLFCAMGDPCQDSLRPCYVVIPRFAADPSMTISLDAETQEVDFSGNLNVD